MSLILDDDLHLENDSRYKNFTVAIEKALKQFESSTEWVDLITNLAKVKKTLEQYSPCQTIPKRITLSKRLSQCLHPALPAGVHLKALEVYQTIFRILDKSHLQRDIFLYSYGLFSLLSVAALPVKPVLLMLYETYFLPLGQALNPILSGFLIGLFSALEEGADYYDRVTALLDDLANRIDQFYFYACVWSAIHSTRAARYSAIVFILKKFDKRKYIEHQIYLAGLSIDTMVSAICVCLYDSQQGLVQRSILDFLLTCLPIHVKLLTEVNRIKLIRATLCILLKRDMSLNRRIYAWFYGRNQFGDDATTNEQKQENALIDSSPYFTIYTHKTLIKSLKNSLDAISIKPISTMIKAEDENLTQSSKNIADSVSSSTWTLTTLIRILLILIDKPDIGPSIIESIFINYTMVFYEHVYYPTKQAQLITNLNDNQHCETWKIFNVLLDTLEPYFIWEYLTKNFEISINQLHYTSSTSVVSSIEQICNVINMLLDIFSSENSLENQTTYITAMLCHLITIMNDNIQRFNSIQIKTFLELLLNIFKTIISTNSNHHLSIIRQSINNNTGDDSDDRNFIDNEYSIDIYNKLLYEDAMHTVNNLNLITEQEDFITIQRLVRQMVINVEKQVDSINDECSDEKVKHPWTKSLAESMNYIKKSIELYKHFFHRFIITYIIDQDNELINEKLHSIYSILKNKTNENLSSLFNRYRNLNEFQLELNDNVDHYVTVFEDCCKLLVEFCCFPMESLSNNESVLAPGKIDFEDWSTDLCILSICTYDHFRLRAMSVSMLIQLFGYKINLKTSPIRTSIDSLINNQSSYSSFTQQQISLLLYNVDFFQYIISYFWEYLNEKYGQECNLKSANILSILHSMLPNNICEDLIYNQIVLINTPETELNENIIDEFRKFFKLWESTHDIHYIKSESITKSFHRCLIYIFTMLKESIDYDLKSIVEQWTYDCFLNGDMYRIFDILLIMLLQPDTARVSIQRFDPLVHKEFFVDQKEIHRKNQLLISSNFNNNSNETKSPVLFEDGLDEDYDDESICHDEADHDDTEDNDKRTRDNNKLINSMESISNVKSSPQTIKVPIISSLSQPIISNIFSLSPPPLLRFVKQRTPTMPNIFNRKNSSPEANLNSPQIDVPSPIINNSFQSHSVPNNNLTNEYNLLEIDDSMDSQYACILIYTQTYDYNRIIRCLDILDSLFDRFQQQLIQTLLITSNIQSLSISIHNKQMHELFYKHRRSIDGKDIHLNNETNQECQSYLYYLLDILLIYTYSYYPKSFDIEKNHRIHIRSLMLLVRICHDLSKICMDNIMLTNYIINLFKKISFQNIVLSLFNRYIDKESDIFKVKVINQFNSEVLNQQSRKVYLKQLMRLLEELILIENIIYSADSNLTHQLTIHQTIFISTILEYLNQTDSIEYHHCVVSSVIKILPHCGSALKIISSNVVEQLCRNLILIIQYTNEQDIKKIFKQSTSFELINYIVSLIEHLAYICNYCLGTNMQSAQHFTATLCPQHWMRRIKMNTNDTYDARKCMLKKFPSIMSCLLFIWKKISMNQINSIWSVNNIKIIREKIIKFISSLTKSNGVSFIKAVVLYWGERKQQKTISFQKDNLSEIKFLIDILMNINNYVINDIIYNMHKLIRYPSASNSKKKQNYVIWCLQLLLGYFEQQQNVAFDCWPILATMLNECLSQSTSLSVTILIIRILSFFLKQSLFLIEKQDLKRLQDIIMKVLENCNSIVASSLEQTNWLRKNLQVRMIPYDSGNQQIANDLSNEIDGIPCDDNSPLDHKDISPSANISFMALNILAENTAKFLDIVSNITDEKDRIIGCYLQNLVNNVMPFIRIHMASNAPAYRSGSTLLMNISQYSYTRKILKKEIFEQLFDIGFFQVDLLTLTTWKTILSNMITDEKSISFRDIMNRINTVQTGLLVSKEQEYEQRAMLIKRLAFVIYACDKDLCNRHLPDILQCIGDLLKLPQIPVLYTQIYLLFRTLLIRILNNNLISFWPIIITEVVQILLQIEQDLLFDSEDDIKSNIQRTIVNDLPTTNISNVSSDTNPLLKMYLYGCKLLDILLVMPYSELYHFQLFRSAFVVDHDISYSNSEIDMFTAFSIRLFKLLEKKVKSKSISLDNHLSITDNSTIPLRRLQSISNIIELFPFFNCLAHIHQKDNPSITIQLISSSDIMKEIEISIIEDFVESWV